MVNPITAQILNDPTFNKNIWTNIQGKYLIVTFYDYKTKKYYKKYILNNDLNYKKYILNIK